jgi:hypothetical protein
MKETTSKLSRNPRKQYQQEYRKGNVKLYLQIKEWQSKHPYYFKRWRERHPHYFKDWLKRHPNYFAEWRKKNKEYLLKYKREYMRKYRASGSQRPH